MKGYIGTYEGMGSIGIYGFEMDGRAGEMSGGELVCEAPDAKFLALEDGVLAAPVKRGEQAGILLADVRGRSGSGSPEGEKEEVLTERVASCYVGMDGGRLFSANFHEGTVSVYRIEGLKADLEKRILIGEGAGCHQVLFSGRRMLVPCMELDEIRVFERDGAFAEAGRIRLPEGSGPRHGVCDREGKRLFIVGQKNNRLYCFHMMEDGEFREAWNLELLDGTEESGNEAAAIRLSADERFLYVSVRGADIVVVVSLEEGTGKVVQRKECGGRHPRDLVLAADGRFLITANRDSRDLVSFPVDQGSGRIGEECGRVRTGRAVCIALEE